jgi:dipeptidase E
MTDQATSSERHIVAMGGGGFSMEPENPLLDDFILQLGAARAADRPGDGRPRICLLPTASGDAPLLVRDFYDAFARRADASWTPLFERAGRPPVEQLLEQDVIYVGGGNTANMLAIWRLHGVDDALREAWARGIVLAGISAGCLCWFSAGITDSYGPELAVLGDGLGLLPWSACPHYDGEARRRPSYRKAVEEGLMAGFAADDGAALHFVGTELDEVVTSRTDAAAYRVERVGGVVVETRLPSRYLGGARPG